ncbi:MAG: glutathione S-transferase family protein [Holophagales bacterium]|nr:glutathione S-transferase family protein [Holophagales bacterium]MXW02337.1 glutathione S-transferase family protein [Holophagales bacterium]MYC09735.1 glutathione S-transferase family protein [Holophagales bacterium]
MRLYWCPDTRANRVVWMLEELGVDYETVYVDVFRPRRSDELLAVSPMGKVPALEDRDVRMCDSSAICLYLADRYGPGVLAPRFEHPDRGRFLQWMIFAPGVIEPAVTEMLSGRAGDPHTNGWGDFDRMISAWEEGLGDGPWILGDRFTAADVVLGATGVLLQRFRLFRAHAALFDYVARCERREAFQRAVTVDKVGPKSLPARTQALAMSVAASLPWVRRPTYWLLDRLRGS